MGEVWTLDVDHARLLILLALADHADDKGRNIYPSLGLVAWKTGYSKRRVRSIVSDLRGEGVLIQVKPSRWHRAAHYRLDLSKLPRKIPLEEEKNREENFSPQESEEGKSRASREEISDRREEISDIREETAISSKSSYDPSLESSENQAQAFFKKGSSDRIHKDSVDKKSKIETKERMKLITELRHSKMPLERLIRFAAGPLDELRKIHRQHTADAR